MSELIPKFKFRAFAQTFGLIAEKLRKLSSCPDISGSAILFMEVNVEHG